MLNSVLEMTSTLSGPPDWNISTKKCVLIRQEQKFSKRLELHWKDEHHSSKRKSLIRCFDNRSQRHISPIGVPFSWYAECKGQSRWLSYSSNHYGNIYIGCFPTTLFSLYDWSLQQKEALRSCVICHWVIPIPRGQTFSPYFITATGRLTFCVCVCPDQIYSPC